MRAGYSPAVPSTDEPVDRGRPAVDRLGSALRDLQDRVATTSAPDDVVEEATAAISRAANLLDPYRYVADRDKRHGDYLSEPGSMTFAPTFAPLSITGPTLTTRVRFPSFYLGSNGAAHGGAVAVVMDELLGRLALTVAGTARNAYLHVEYRNVTPLDVDLDLMSTVDRVDGRKFFLSGRMMNGDTLVAEATALFVRLREGSA